MLIFQKKYVERLALKRLMELNPYKYKNAYIEGCERPDIQNIKRYIGLEVTSCDFKPIYIWHKYYGRELMELFKVERIKPIRFKKLVDYCVGEYGKEYMDELISEEIYLERKSKLRKLKKYDDFYNLNKEDKLYKLIDLNWDIKLDEKLNIKYIKPDAFWPHVIVKKLKKLWKRKKLNLRIIKV